MKSVRRPGSSSPESAPRKERLSPSEQRLRRRDGHRHRAASAPALDRAREPLVAPHPKRASDRAAWRIPVEPDAANTAAATSVNLFDRASKSPQLWLACRFVDLPVDALLTDQHIAPGLNPLTPVVVHDGHARQPVLIACNNAARRHGLHPGMRLGVAHTLVAGIQAYGRDENLEALVLEKLAMSAMDFSSRLIVESPDTLLLEIGASLRLFHSLEALLDRFTQRFERDPDRLAEDITVDGYRLSLAVSPVAATSRLLCKNDNQRCVIGPDELHSALASIPLSDLPLSQRVFKTLRGMGLARLGDVMRLPRDGLGRRVGPDVVSMIDRLSGRVADPHRFFQPADHFRSNITLTDDIVNIDQLLLIAGRLIEELCTQLKARNSGVNQLAWQFDHHDRSSTCITLNISKPTGDASQFVNLMRTRTENMILPGPVHTVTLRSSRFELLTLRPVGLFPEIEEATPHFDLIDRLRARLGDDQISSLQTCNEHTPEHAWRPSEPAANAGTGAARKAATTSSEISSETRRPLWLLNAPRRLRCSDGIPWLHGPLKLIDGPERIETGWWEQNIRRDYYVALSSRGRHLWVFYDIRADAWFMQGAFL